MLKVKEPKQKNVLPLARELRIAPNHISNLASTLKPQTAGCLKRTKFLLNEYARTTNAYEREYSPTQSMNPSVLPDRGQ